MPDIDGLVRVPGVGVELLATAGTEDHARSIGLRAARAHAWLSDLLGFRPDVRVCALGPQDWGRVTAFPVFGFPHFVGEGTIVVGSVGAPFFG